ncbi:MAG: TolB family protein [Acidimicrobiales bacterium]
MGEGKNKWRLDEELHSDDCTGGRADSPAWSPNGKRIAFFASSPSGKEGFSRLNKPWDLYLMDPETLELEKIVKGVSSAHSPTWSPNNQWIAYIEEGMGILLVSAKGGKPKYISKMPAQELAWSPNGDELAFRVQSDPSSIEDFSSKIFIMDVSELSK